jgi:copper chaperone
MTTEFFVPGATCGHCKQTIEGTISAIDGVTVAELDLDSKILRIEHNEALEADALAEAVSAAGYSPEVRE